MELRAPAQIGYTGTSVSLLASGIYGIVKVAYLAHGPSTPTKFQPDLFAAAPARNGRMRV